MRNLYNPCPVVGDLSLSSVLQVYHVGSSWHTHGFLLLWNLVICLCCTAAHMPHMCHTTGHMEHSSSCDSQQHMCYTAAHVPHSISRAAQQCSAAQQRLWCTAAEVMALSQLPANLLIWDPPEWQLQVTQWERGWLQGPCCSSQPCAELRVKLYTWEYHLTVTKGRWWDGSACSSTCSQVWPLAMIPEPHTVGGGNWLCKLSSDFHMYPVACIQLNTCVHTQVHARMNGWIFKKK